MVRPFGLLHANDIHGPRLLDSRDIHPALLGLNADMDKCRRDARADSQENPCEDDYDVTRPCTWLRGI